MICRCGHPRSAHIGSSGPNSIGRWNFGECIDGSWTDGYYRVGGCACSTFRRSIRLSIRDRFKGRRAHE